VNKMCFCALFRLSNGITQAENAIFRWFCFPQVVQEQTLNEVESWMVIWCPVISEIFTPKKY